MSSSKRITRKDGSTEDKARENPPTLIDTDAHDQPARTGRLTPSNAACLVCRSITSGIGRLGSTVSAPRLLTTPIRTTAMSATITTTSTARWTTTTDPHIFILSSGLLPPMATARTNNSTERFIADPTDFIRVVPHLYTVSGSLSIIIMLCFLNALAIHPRPFFVVLATAMGAIVQVVAMILVTYSLRDAWSMMKSIHAAQYRLSIVVLMAFGRTCISFAQVQMAMGLFVRHTNRAIIAWFGIILTLATLTAQTVNEIDESVDYFYRYYVSLVPPSPSYSKPAPIVAYTLELLLNSTFTLILLYFGISRRRLAFLSFQHSLLGVLALLWSIIPIIFFCFDVFLTSSLGWGYWVYLASLIICINIAFEWMDRVDRAHKEAKRAGILGQQVYDDNAHKSKFAFTVAPKRRFTALIKTSASSVAGALVASWDFVRKPKATSLSPSISCSEFKTCTDIEHQKQENASNKSTAGSWQRHHYPIARSGGIPQASSSSILSVPTPSIASASHTDACGHI